MASLIADRVRSFGLALLGGWGLLALGAQSCAPSHGRVDPDAYDEVGGGGTESSDVRAMVSRMTRDLLASERLFAGPGKPSLFMLGLQNRSSHPINRQLVLESIQTDLVRNSQGRLAVIDRSAATLEVVRAERRAKREGALTGNAKKELLGSDYVLTGTVDTISKRGGGGMSSDYWVYNFRLADLESSELIWANRYEFKWAGNKPAIYR